MVREIPLTQAYVTLVDDADYEFLMQFNWSTHFDDGGVARYARLARMIDGKFYSTPMHRVIAAAPIGVEVDHWDGNGLNNQRENLRVCSRRQNAQNTRRRDGLKGASKIGAASWHCTMTVNGESRHFGTYHSATFCAKVYDAAARRLYGEFAATNFPDIDPEADAIAAHVIAGGQPPRPEKLPRVMTEENAREIRRLYAAGGVLGKDLAKQFECSAPLVYQILQRRSWNEFDDGLQDQISKVAKSQKGGWITPATRKLSIEQVTEIKRRYRPRVVTAASLAIEFGVSSACIYSILGGHTWKDQAA